MAARAVGRRLIAGLLAAATPAFAAEPAPPDAELLLFLAEFGADDAELIAPTDLDALPDAMLQPVNQPDADAHTDDDADRPPVAPRRR